MRIKKFTAHSLKDATHQMRIELGPEAIILNTRTVPRVNGRGLFGRDTCEVTAAIDDGDSAPKPGGTDRRQPSVPFTRYLESQHDPARAAQTKASPADEMTKVAEGFEARRGGSAPASRPVPQQAADVLYLERVAKLLFEIEKADLDWRVPLILLPKHKAKLLMNMLLIAAGSVPRGGVVKVEVTGPQGAEVFKLTSTSNPEKRQKTAGRPALAPSPCSV